MVFSSWKNTQTFSYTATSTVGNLCLVRVDQNQTDVSHKQGMSYSVFCMRERELCFDFVKIFSDTKIFL